MDILIEIGSLLAAGVAGVVIGSFTIGNLVLSTSFGIQLSVRLRNKGLFESRAPFYRYLITFLINALIIGAVVTAVGFYFASLLPAFLFGLGFVILQLGSDHVRYSNDNLKDFIQTNSQSFTRDVSGLTEAELKDLFDLRNTEDIEGNQLFARVFGELISNSLFLGVLTVGVLVIGSFFWWVGVILAGALAVFAVLSILQTAFLGLMAPIGLIIQLFSGNRSSIDSQGRELWKEQIWLTAALVPRIIEVLIDSFFMLTLYRFFFPFST